MSRRSWYLLIVAIGSMPFSSCTCFRDAPELPKHAQRRSGFGAALPTARALPDKRLPEGVPMARVTPVQPALPPSVDAGSQEPAGLPENFPPDIPVIENAEVFAVQELPGNAKNVLFLADAEPPEIFVYYRDTMKEEGWNVTQQYEHKDQSFLSFRKGKMITNMTVSVDPKTGKRIVAVMYYEEEPLPFPEF